MRRIMLVSFLALSLMTGCGGIQDNPHTLQKTTSPDSDRYIVKEYNQHRAFMLSHNNNVQHSDLAVRLASEAERVFNVYRAVAIINGQDIIMGVTTKTDPLETQHETLENVRQRLENKVPTLSGYNLHMTADPLIQQEIMKARTFLENAGPDEYSRQQSKQHFQTILQRMNEVRR